MAQTEDTYVLRMEADGKKVIQTLNEIEKMRTAAQKAEDARLKAGGKVSDMQHKQYNKEMTQLAQRTAALKKVYATEKEIFYQLSRSIKGRTEEIQRIYNLVNGKNNLTAKEMRQQIALAEELIRRNKAEEEQLKGITKNIELEATSIKGLKEQVKSLTEQYNLLSEAERKGTKGKDIQQKIKDANMQLKLSETTFAGATEISKYDITKRKLQERLKVLRDLRLEYVNMSNAEQRSARGRELANKIAKTKAEVQKFNKELGNTEKAIEKTTKKSTSLWNNFSAVFKKVGLQFIGGVLGYAQATVALGNAFKDTIRIAIDFNKEVSKLASILGSSPAKIKELTIQARKLGEGTRFTAQQVVKLQTELAKLGFNKGQILGMADSVLKFAQAVGTDLPDAAKTTGSVMRIFDYTAHDTEEVLNMLAKATTSSALTFEYISTALPIAGQAAKQSGFQMQDLIAILGTLANSGMSASMAATATRNIFLKMADANGVLVKTLGKQPKTLKELIDGMNELNEKGVNLNDILQMTGVRASVAFASLLDGTDSIEELKKKIEESNGAIEQMRKTMDDNLEGAIKRLNSAWDEFAISLNKSQGTIQKIVDYLAKGITAFSHTYVDTAEDSINKEAEEKRKELLDERFAQTFWNINYKRYKQIYESVYKKSREDEKMSEKEAQKAALSQAKTAIDYDRERYQNAEKEAYQALTNAYDAYEQHYLKRGLTPKEFRGKSTELVQEYFTEIRHRKSEKQTASDVGDILNERTNIAINRAKLQVQDMFLDALSKEFKLDEDSSGVGAGKHKGEFVDTITEKLRAENKQLELQNKLLDEGAEKRRDNIETSFAQQINEEDKALLRLSKLIVKAKKMDEKQTLEYEGIVYTKADAIRIGYEAMEIRRQNIQKLNRLSIKELGKNQLKEKVITLKYSKQLLNAQLENVREYSEEYYEIKKQMLLMDNAIALEEAHVRFVSEMYVTEEQEKELAETLKALRKKGYTEEEVKQYEHLERMQYNFENYAKEVELLNKKHNKQMTDISYQESQTNLSNQKSAAYGSVDWKKSEAQRKVEKAQAKLQDAANRVNDAENNPNPKLSPEQQKEELAKAQEEYNNAYRELRNAMMDLATIGAQIKLDVADRQWEQLKLGVQIAKERLKTYEEVNQGMFESDKDYELNKSKLRADAKKKEKEYTLFKMDLYMQAASSVSTSLSTISQAMMQNSKDSEKNARRAQIIGLAAIYIDQAVAIAHAIRNAASSSFTVVDLIAKIATAVTTVIAATAQAQSTIKKAKFAQGSVDIQGPGTGTSDSIPAMISKGESVMTARATKMFKPLLLAMNDIAAQPNVTLPTSYSGYNAAQVAATKEQLTDSFRDSVKDIHPRVSVVEFHDVDDRYNIVKSLDNV